MCSQPDATLDRAQREAIRDEMELASSGWGDIRIGFRNGERAYVERQAFLLSRMVELMDAVGWTEQPDTPDSLPVECSATTAAWAKEKAVEILASIAECDPSEPTDKDLDAYAGLCAIGGGA